MRRSEDAILTTHVGSLIRPPVLLDYLRRRQQNEPVDEAQYLRDLREQVHDVVRRQVDVGLDIINDGEYGKSSWSAYVLERMEGFEIRPDEPQPLNWLGRDLERFRDFFAEEMPRAITGMAAEVCVGPIRYRDRDSVLRDIDNLRSAPASAGAVETFMTAVAPASTAYNGVNEYYASDREYIFAIADALREEYRAIHDAGMLLQVDDAVLANMYDHLAERGEFRRWAELRIEALNHALRDIPEDRVRYHVCFGSWHVPHVADAPLADIIDLVLKVNAGAYSIEAANARHEHEWELWSEVTLPEGKSLIPGVITHHTTTVEHPDLVAQRLTRFANLIGKENVIAGTDCGFAQGQGTQRVHPSVMWAKFEAQAEGARISTDRLWGK